MFRATVRVGTLAVHLNDYKTEFVNTSQNLLELAKFQTLATSPLVLANLQIQASSVNPRLVNTFK